MSSCLVGERSSEKLEPVTMAEGKIELSSKGAGRAKKPDFTVEVDCAQNRFPEYGSST